MNKPNFFIVGAPKCGTTAMNEYLAQHPEIFMGKKELHFFGKDLKTRIKISEQEYLKNFEDTGNAKVIGEASVWYLFSKTAAQEIKAFSPGARILIMLRNPIEVMHSLHSQHLYDGNEDVWDFETAVNLDKERRNGKKLPKSLDFIELPPYIDTVLFYQQVKRYLDIFGTSNVHIILFEDFIRNNEKAVKDVFQFLDVSQNVQINYMLVNPNKQVKWFYLHRLIKNPNLRTKKLTRIIFPFKRLRHFIMKSLLNWNIKIKKRAEMNPELNTTLKGYAENDIHALSELIKKDLSQWLQ